MTKPKLLVVEDDEAICSQLKYALRNDYLLSFASDRDQALAQLAEFQPRLISLDLGLPPHPDTAQEGLQLLEEVLRLAPVTKIIVVTGNGDHENALRAVQLGAFDYYQKPIVLEEFQVILRRAAHLQQLEQQSESWLRDQEQSVRFEDLLGTTPAMLRIFEMINRVARTGATVLIEGESGTGKELIARAIHGRSRRHDNPFVPINCGAIPETLLEAELFGHERGAFTGAHIQRKGKFETAHTGTLFLDEIGELGLLLQVKLLRFLQERTIERVGGREPIQLDLRVIAATNRNLKVRMEQGLFREDLYYRLSVVTIKVPPLRERAEDILLLAHTILRRASREHRRRVRFSPDATRALLAYGWPGNIRELQNKVSRAVILARGRVIQPPDLEIEPAFERTPISLREARDQVERERLVEVLARHRGNISQAARELGVSRPTLHSLLDKHNVDAKVFR